MEKQRLPRRQRDEQMLSRDGTNDTNHFPRRAPAASNDFASLEAMLASQTSDDGTAHIPAHSKAHHENGQAEEAPPSSPSTLSNDSVAAATAAAGVSPPKEKIQLHPARLYNNNNEPAEPKFRMHPPPAVRSPPSNFRGHNENLQSRPRPKKTPTVAHTAKSIVGSRPRHWGVARGHTVSDPTIRRSNALGNNSRKRKLAAELHKSSALRSIPRNLVPTPKSVVPALPDDNRVEQLAAAAATVSFAPSFISPPSRGLQTSTSSMLPTEPILDTVENTDDTVLQPLSPHTQKSLAWMSPTPMPPPPPSWAQQHPQYASSSAGSPYSPATTHNHTRHRKSNSKHHQQQQRMGPLRKRLQAVRSAVDGDVIRLQSGQYPFSLRRSMDRNDPRNRATTVCDLTIVGQHFVPWGTGEYYSSGGGNHNKNTQQQPHHRLVTVLSHVHSWTRPLDRSVVATNSETSSENHNNFNENDALGLVWAVFTQDKAREQSLGKGTQLRVYNAICIPAGDNGGSAVQKMMLCTNLCEPYPSSVLPPLPDVSATIAETEAIATK